MDARTLFEIFFPLVVFFIVWRIASRSRKARPVDKVVVGGDKAEKTEVTINLLDVLKHMVSGGMELPQSIKQQYPQERAEPIELPQDLLQGAEEELPEERPAFAKIERRASREVRPEEKTAKPEEFVTKKAGLPRKKLQQAVVWSEILAPPVALKNDETP